MMRSNARVAIAAATASALVSAAAGQTLTTEVVVDRLTRPVQVVSTPSEPDRIYIVEQFSGTQGRVRIFDLANNELLASPFLTQSVSTGNEQGLLGLAFHPEYATNRRLFINYTNTAGTTIVAEWARNPLGNLNATFVRNVISVSQPFSNHNAGWLGFSPINGYLYIPLGDGGSANDPGNRAQDLTAQLLGKIVRIDVNGDDFPADSTRNYAIPPSNPFVGLTPDDEIFAYGLRNPFRCAFDAANGDLYMGDVGQNAREEVSYLPATSPGGENFGWRCWEGNLDTPNVANDCGPSSGITFPLIDYTRAGGTCSVIGGPVYRGTRMPALQGTYFYADYCSADFWSFRLVNGVVTEFQNRNAQLRYGPSPSSFPTSFGTDAAGEMYIVDQSGGRIRRIIPVPCNGADLADVVGTLDINDVLVFANAFNDMTTAADLFPDGMFDINDVLSFAALFNAGCP